jgi:predicted nucleic acid-binding protein
MKIFLDVCAWFTAINSPEGGAGRVLSLATDEALLVIVLTPEIFRDTGHNLWKKSTPDAVSRFRQAVESPMIRIIPDPTPEELDPWREITVPKDWNVLAGALKAKADAMITLDEAHLLTRKVQESFPIPVFRPGSFIRWFQSKDRFK